MAADALDTAIRGMGPGPRSRTRRLRLGCGRLDVLTATATGRAERLRLDPGLAPALVRRYGDRALAVLDLVEETGLATPIADEPTHVAAEALYAIRAEMAIDLEDFMARRIRLALTDRDGGADRAVSSLFGTERGWSAKETRAQESRYLKSLERERPVADRAGA
ncbi:MAG: glycerol-3-phosphate dehydrogenase C-terminal domain-containing protein [Actinomycetota bacterium]